MTGRVLAVGIDGASGGWVRAAATNADGSLRISMRFATDLQSAVDDGDAQTPVCVDVPIGLPEGAAARACDREARVRLKGRASTVFPAPPRYVLQAKTYAEARERVAAERSRDPAARGISAQSFALIPKIEKADELVRRLGPEPWLREAHPEVSFVRMADAAGRAGSISGKRTARGVARRITLLEAVFGTSVLPLMDVPELDAVGDVTDALDALACLWTALRVRNGDHERLGDGAHDALGVAMQIVA